MTRTRKTNSARRQKAPTKVPAKKKKRKESMTRKTTDEKTPSVIIKDMMPVQVAEKVFESFRRNVRVQHTRLVTVINKRLSVLRLLGQMSKTTQNNPSSTNTHDSLRK